MSEVGYIQLKTSSINNIPFQSYDEFVFIVNGKEYKTSRIISDLLSPKVCQLHLSDPTINKYTFKTKHKGDFSQFLKLINFERLEQTETDYDFIMEVIEKLGNDSIEFSFQSKNTKVTNKNVFKLLHNHSKYPHFFADKINEEIDFISSHFYELFDTVDQNQKLQDLNIDIVEQIIDNPKLKLKSENQLLSVINKLYSEDSEYSILYEYVDFKVVGSKSMKEFINIFDLNDMNTKMWRNLSKRLDKEIFLKSKNLESKRYLKQNYDTNDPFAPPRVKKAEDPFSVPRNNNNNTVNDPFAVLRNNNIVDPFEQTQIDPFAQTRNAHYDDDPFSLHRRNGPL